MLAVLIAIMIAMTFTATAIGQHNDTEKIIQTCKGGK